MDRDVLKWMQDSRKAQNSFCNILGTREYDEVEEGLLGKKIGFAIYGTPKGKSYSEEQLELINEIKEKIASYSKGRILVAVVYVLIKLKSNNEERTQVVFRLPLDKNELSKGSYFIDLSVRVYKSWSDYLETNKLPKCDMCWPTEGKYREDDTGRALINFGESNACDVMNTVINVVDITSMAGAIGSVGVLGVALFTPVSLPIMLAAGGVSVVLGTYDAGRNIAELIDLSQHEESLTSPKALMRWFGVISSAVCVMSAGTSAAMKTAEGFGATKISKITKLFNISSLCMNGVSAFSGMVNVILKALDGRLNESDISSFIGYCLFLYNAVIETTVLAARMIHQICNSSISILSHVSNKCRIVAVNAMLHVSKFSENYMQLVNLIIGVPVQFLAGIFSHKIECTILKIKNYTTFLLKMTNDLKNYAHFVSGTLQELYDVCKHNIQQILNMVNKWRFPFNPKLFTAFFKNKSGKSFPQPLNIKVFHDMCVIVRNLAEKFSVGQSEEEIKKKEIIIMRQVSQFDSLKPAENLSEYYSKLECFSTFLRKKFDSFKEEYDNQLDVEMLSGDLSFKEEYDNELDIEMLSAGLDVNEFNTKNGIEGNVNEHFFKKSIEISNHEFKELQNMYTKMMKKSSFTTTVLQDVHYESVFPFCYPPNVTYLTKNEYFSYATDFVGIEVNEKTSELFEEGPLVVLSPLLESKIPYILFYKPDQLSSEGEHHVGIAVVQKNISVPDNLPTSLLKRPVIQEQCGQEI